MYTSINVLISFEHDLRGILARIYIFFDETCPPCRPSDIQVDLLLSMSRSELSWRLLLV